MKSFFIFMGLTLAMFYSIQPTLAADQTSSIIANNQICHILEDTPSCSGIAPQKSQNADMPLKASLSSRDRENYLKSSKTDMNRQRTLDELSGRLGRD
ncbi:MAG: hypothetical protein NTY51_13480 [Deltaproteobacteria bacterium]|nr:hypothetical protein [Deltaproteobacteria bacterium]